MCRGSRREAEIAALSDLQRRLLDRAVELTEPRRHDWSIASARSSQRKASSRSPALLARDPRVVRVADRGSRNLRPRRSSSPPPASCARLPLHLPDPEPRWGGIDGFYAARLRRM